jgi:MoaD family protein
MVAVTVKVFASLRERLGWREKSAVDPSFERIVDVLKKMPGQDGTLYETLMDADTGDLSDRYSIMLNGRNSKSLEGLESQVSEGDRILIFPPVGGG